MSNEELNDKFAALVVEQAKTEEQMARTDATMERVGVRLVILQYLSFLTAYPKTMRQSQCSCQTTSDTFFMQ